MSHEAGTGHDESHFAPAPRPGAPRPTTRAEILLLMPLAQETPSLEV